MALFLLALGANLKTIPVRLFSKRAMMDLEAVVRRVRAEFVEMPSGDWMGTPVTR
jgi:hypothetical protein